MLVANSTSQPLAALPSQLPKPALQAMVVQLPPAQVGAPLVLLHATPQRPQLRASVASVVSQLPLPSQSAVPPPQMLRPHTPATQVGVRPVMVGQMVPQARQLVVSVLRLVSQPLLGSRSQSPKPAAQGPIVHAPATQLAVALAKRQRLLHAPQLFGSVLMLVSQPAMALQSPKPGRHAVWLQRLDTHEPKALGKAASQLVPHAPQLAALVTRSTQMGAVAPIGVQAVRLDGQRHVPAEQSCPSGQRRPQAAVPVPQLLASVAGLMQPTPAQNTCPVIGHRHTPARHTSPPLHAWPQPFIALVPQLFTSVARLVQPTPAQKVRLALPQMHALALQR